MLLVLVMGSELAAGGLFPGEICCTCSVAHPRLGCVRLLCARFGPGRVGVLLSASFVAVFSAVLANALGTGRLPPPDNRGDCEFE